MSPPAIRHDWFPKFFGWVRRTRPRGHHRARPALRREAGNRNGQTLHCERRREQLLSETVACLNCADDFYDCANHQIVARANGEWIGVICRLCLSAGAREWLLEIERRYLVRCGELA